MAQLLYSGTEIDLSLICTLVLIANASTAMVVSATGSVAVAKAMTTPGMMSIGSVLAIGTGRSDRVDVCNYFMIL